MGTPELTKFVIRVSTEHLDKGAGFAPFEFPGAIPKWEHPRMTTIDSPELAATARSFLFVPGDCPERFDKAWNSPADAVILDLEDAVSIEKKDVARQAVRAWLSATRPVWIRCNAADTPWFQRDLELCEQDGVAGFMLPKAEQIPAHLQTLFQTRRLRVIPIIETALGFQAAIELALAPCVVRLAFGALDFQVDTGIEGDDDALLYFRSQLVLASRLAGKAAPIDGVTTAIDEPQLLRNDTQRARRLGMGAKLCIHPAQIGTVHETLEPTREERDWAQRVMEAMKMGSGAAVQVDGKMVDRPLFLRAQKISNAPSSKRSLRF